MARKVRTINLNPPAGIRFHEGSGQSLNVQFEAGKETDLIKWFDSAIVEALNKPSHVHVELTQQLTEENAEYIVAKCFNCESKPISPKSGMTGLCDDCYKISYETKSVVENQTGDENG